MSSDFSVPLDTVPIEGNLRLRGEEKGKILEVNDEDMNMNGDFV